MRATPLPGGRCCCRVAACQLLLLHCCCSPRCEYAHRQRCCCRHTIELPRPSAATSLPLQRLPSAAAIAAIRLLAITGPPLPLTRCLLLSHYRHCQLRRRVITVITAAGCRRRHCRSLLRAATAAAAGAGAAARVAAQAQQRARHKAATGHACCHGCCHRRYRHRRCSPPPSPATVISLPLKVTRYRRRHYRIRHATLPRWSSPPRGHRHR